MDYTYTTTITNGSTTATVSDTRKMYEGMYIYGTGMPICNQIDSITDSTTIEFTYPATEDGVNDLVYTELNPNQYLERCQARKAVQDIVNEIGTALEVIVRDEDQITRGKYQSIKRRTQSVRFIVKAFPVVFSPSTEQLEKAGLRLDADVMVSTASKDWTDAGYDFSDIDLIRMTIKLMGETYELKEKTRYSQYNNDFVYFNIGMKKK